MVGTRHNACIESCQMILPSIAHLLHWSKFCNLNILARICATKQSRTKSLATNIRTIPKNMPTNFQLKRLKLKLDIVEKPKNRVHKLTDSNGARVGTVIRICQFVHSGFSGFSTISSFGFNRSSSKLHPFDPRRGLTARRSGG